MLILDVAFNLPRQRMSGSMRRVILLILRLTGARDVPSFDRLCEVQKSLRSQCGVPTLGFKSALGNVFFINDPRTIIAHVCFHFSSYCILLLI